jgi:hypothetical protein
MTGREHSDHWNDQRSDLGMAHHAGQPARCEKAPLTTGRLALWLAFWLLMSIMFMGTVVTLSGKGTGQ